jgi:hypothetical protein
VTVPQSTSPTQQPPSPFAQPWPQGVIARYLTIAGATVDLTRTNDGKTVSRCTGCGDARFPNSELFLRGEANSHAERCRALPRPEAQR